MVTSLKAEVLEVPTVAGLEKVPVAPTLAGIEEVLEVPAGA